jgi:excinuclease ABC subunit A
MMKKRVSRYMVSALCPVCEGKRLKPEALSVTFAGYDIGALSQLPIEQSRRSCGRRRRARGRCAATASAVARRLAPRHGRAWRKQAAPRMRPRPTCASRPAVSEEKRIAAQRLAHDLLARMRTLEQLGLGYLSLDRSTPTLSPGELQRLRLATQLGSHLFGVIYVLDEPSAGLHPADGEALLTALQR